MRSDAPSVCIVFGTRPEAIKLAPVISRCRQSSILQTQVVLTGQHREMVEQVLALFEIEADRDLQIMRARQTLTDITCLSLQGLEKEFTELQPGLVLVQGDTTTAFAAALAAFYQQIPVGHVEAGLRSRDLFNPYPEEANRRLIGQLCQLHFAPTQLATDNLRDAGVVGDVHLTGNTVIDALLATAERQPDCQIPGLDWGRYRTILATVHRRENWGEPLANIIRSFETVLNRFPDTALLLPLHRNPVVRDPIRAALGEHPRVYLTEPLDYAELVGALQRCYLLLTDSGGLQEEAPSLGKPVLVLRETTERLEAIAAGTTRLVGTDPERIVTAASELLSDPETYRAMATAVNPFGDGRAAERIVKLVEAYLAPQSVTHPS